MTSKEKLPSEKDRPFPWHCIECGHDEIFPLATDYTVTETHDNKSYAIHIPDLEIPTCRNCGERLFTTRVDARINAALRTEAGLLSPKDIESIREELGLSPRGMADELCLTENTLLDWETGARIQPRAVDKQLRQMRLMHQMEDYFRRIDEFVLREPQNAKLLDMRRNDRDAQFERLYALADGKRRFVCADPTTGKPHALDVPCEIQSCYQAQQWLSHGLDQYAIGRS